MGILQNNDEVAKRSDGANAFDRGKVKSNTELNAKLGSEGEALRRRIHEQSQAHGRNTKYPKTKAPSAIAAGGQDDVIDEAVHWNDGEISEWDKTRGSRERIMEPNTPYLGTAADTEYYDAEAVDDLDLGVTED